MASRVIHVGQDTCHRLAVLQSAGYHVEPCASIPELQEALAGQDELDAVLVSEGTDGAHLDAVQLARQQTSAPIVLFRHTQRTFAESSFDLVVPILVPPQTWLAEMAMLIDHSQAVRSISQGLRKQSVDLRHSSTVVRTQSEKERQRARAQCSKKFPPPGGLVGGPGHSK